MGGPPPSPPQTLASTVLGRGAGPDCHAFFPLSPLPGVRHNLVDQITLLLVVVGADLRGQRDLLVVAVVAGDDVEVDARRLAGEDAGGGALLAEVDLGAVDLVQQHGRDDAHDLQRQVLRLDGVDRRDQRVHHQRDAVRVLDRHGVGLALDDDDGVVALADQDRVGERGFDFDGLGFLLEVFL